MYYNNDGFTHQRPGEYAKLSPKSRLNPVMIWVIVATMLVIVLGEAVVVMFVSNYGSLNSHQTSIDASQAGASDYMWFYIIAIMLVYVIVLTISLIAYQKGKRQYQQQIGDLDRSSDQLRQSLSGHTEVDVPKSIQLQLNELKGYYISARRQADIAFLVGIASIITGIVIMAMLVITAFFFKSTDISLSYLIGILSAITEFIGASALAFYSRISKKADRYFESLNKLLKTTFAADLLDKYSDEDKKQQALDRIVDSLLVDGLLNDKPDNKEETK